MVLSNSPSTLSMLSGYMAEPSINIIPPRRIYFLERAYPGGIVSRTLLLSAPTNTWAREAYDHNGINRYIN